MHTRAKAQKSAGGGWVLCFGLLLACLVLDHPSVEIELHELMDGYGLDLGDGVWEQLENGEAHQLVREFPAAA